MDFERAPSWNSSVVVSVRLQARYLKVVCSIHTFSSTTLWQSLFVGRRNRRNHNFVFFFGRTKVIQAQRSHFQTPPVAVRSDVVDSASG